MSEGEEYQGSAAEHDAPIPYMQRIRDYYQGLGYGAPYRWAHYAEVPFQPPEKPLAECRVALITTSRIRATRVRARPTTPPRNSTRSIRRIRPSIMICGSPTSGSIECTPAPRTATPGSPCRNCAAVRRQAGSARSHHASTARRPTAAIARRSSGTALNCWRAAAPMAPTPPFSSPIDRCATRP
jgi:hypothetical protein